MGARAVMESRLLWVLTDEGVHYEYVGRPVRASPGEGYPPAHRAEQARILREALEVGDGAGGGGDGAGAGAGASAGGSSDGGGVDGPSDRAEARSAAATRR